jgi:5-methylcytosine-specific restriction endonuclease McrA
MKLGAKKRRRALKLKVIEKYGGKCVLCRESRPIFLTLDHVNNDGAQHRQELGGKCIGSYIYTWAAKNGYPDRLQLLCYNCNMAKSTYGLDELLKVLNESEIVGA